MTQKEGSMTQLILIHQLIDSFTHSIDQLDSLMRYLNWLRLLELILILLGLFDSFTELSTGSISMRWLNQGDILEIDIRWASDHSRAYQDIDSFQLIIPWLTHFLRLRNEINKVSIDWWSEIMISEIKGLIDSRTQWYSIEVSFSISDSVSPFIQSMTQHPWESLSFDWEPLIDNVINVDRDRYFIKHLDIIQLF